MIQCALASLMGNLHEFHSMSLFLWQWGVNCAVLPYIHFADSIFARDKKLAYEPIRENNAIIISTEESRVFLRNIGIDGEIVATTSHSADSISLILDSGECFVGDLEPIEYLAAYEKNDRLKHDWRLVMHYAPKKIYYAHANEKYCG